MYGAAPDPGGAIYPKSEVHEHDSAAVLPHDVLRLDVTVRKVHRMQGGQAAADIDTDKGRFSGAECAVPVEPMLQGCAANQLHPQADTAVLCRHAVNGNDIGVASCGRRRAS